MSKKSVLNTDHAPPLKEDTLITYSDTIFRKDALSALANADADIVVGVDSNWKFRYHSRTEEDIEVLALALEDYGSLQKDDAIFWANFLSARVASVISIKMKVKLG